MDKFFAEAQRKNDDKPQSTSSDRSFAGVPVEGKKSLPKGVVLGKDGKPCRSCTSFAAWAQRKKAETSSSSSTTSTLPSITAPSSLSSTDSEPTQPAHCPPDVETLGRSTWTFLHTLSAAYPTAATQPQQSDMKQFLGLFSRLYPCWHCAEDFQTWLKKPGNEPRVGGREDFGRWMCEAHNEVNKKLGKETFNCNLWKERWKDGPDDGSCG